MSRKMSTEQARAASEARKVRSAGGRGGRFPNDHIKDVPEGGEPCTCSGCILRAKWRAEDKIEQLRELRRIEESVRAAAMQNPDPLLVGEFVVTKPRKKPGSMVFGHVEREDLGPVE